jgi:fructan beta-fructosidase
MKWRPRFHHAPAANWMNDPNGLVFSRGMWHLHYQYHPGSSVWGPMHWGRATSTDLLHWQEQPVALAPDELGMVFSGCIVIDEADTSGFGRDGIVPWVALYTSHGDVESQSLAVSLDEGTSWQRPAGLNPVLPNPGAKDIRDPKVFWHAERGRWVMSLAAGDHIRLYASADLKTWAPLSSFGGPGAGAHGGVWECPDLIRFDSNGQPKWVLLVSLNPGGPNGGSATQYWVGDFDGTTFEPEHSDIRWLDHGPDHYAGVTWHGVRGRVLLTGWMSNWLYAHLLPTNTWRGAMTLPRELRLVAVNGRALLAQQPAREAAGQVLRLRREPGFTLKLGNAAGDEVLIGHDRPSNRFFIDRSRSGVVGFHPGFAERHTAPRLEKGPEGPIELALVLDACSVEFFADNGLTTLTSLVFPHEPLQLLKG